MVRSRLTRLVARNASSTTSKDDAIMKAITAVNVATENREGVCDWFDFPTDDTFKPPPYEQFSDLVRAKCTVQFIPDDTCAL